MGQSVAFGRKPRRMGLGGGGPSGTATSPYSRSGRGGGQWQGMDQHRDVQRSQKFWNGHVLRCACCRDNNGWGATIRCVILQMRGVSYEFDVRWSVPAGLRRACGTTASDRLSHAMGTT